MEGSMSEHSSFVEFIKTASCTVGAEVNNMPAKLACDAYTLYKNLADNPDKVKIARSLYANIVPGYDKIAMEMVAVNILADIDKEKTAGVMSTAGTALNGYMNYTQAKGVYDTTKSNIQRMKDNTNSDNLYSMGFNPDYKLKN